MPTSDEGIGMFKHKSLLHRSLIIAADMYSFYLSLIVLVWLASGERFFFVNIIVSLMPGIFYFLPIALLISFWQRTLRTGILTCVPIIVFFAIYTPSFQAHEGQEVIGTSLTLLTYNLRASNINTEELDSILVSADADIVALQEVSFEIGEWVTQTWQDYYPYQVRFTIEDESTEYSGRLPLLASDVSQYAGRMLLSRYPILDYDIVPSSIGTTLYVRAEIDINGLMLTTYNVHLPPPLPIDVFSTDVRHRNLLQILEVAQSDDAVILMGDYNMSDQSEDYELMSSRYTDVFSATRSGFGTTFPNGNNLSPLLSVVPPMIRIDYIFVGRGIVAQSAQVIYDGVSDHYPVYAEVVVE